MRINKKGTFFCFLVLCIPSVFAQSNRVENTEGLHLVEATIVSPSGPIRKTEWIEDKTFKLIRIQYRGITAGRPILGRVRVLLLQNGCWVVEDKDGTNVPLKCPKSIEETGPVLVTDMDQRWSVTVVSVHNAPSVIPGVANEGEPSIDLDIRRISN